MAERQGQFSASATLPFLKVDFHFWFMSLYQLVLVLFCFNFSIMVSFLNHRHNHLIAQPKTLHIVFFVTQVRWKSPMLLKSRLSSNLRSIFGSVHFDVLQPFCRPLFIAVSLPTLFSWLGISSPSLLPFHPFLTPDRICTSCKALLYCHLQQEAFFVFHPHCHSVRMFLGAPSLRKAY